MTLRWTVNLEDRAYRRPFIIARGVLPGVTCLIAVVQDGAFIGRGEAEPHESDRTVAKVMLAEAREFLGQYGGALDRALLHRLLPAGPLRNALDCALWDLAAKQAGRGIADLTGIALPPRLPVTATVSLDMPKVMAAEARDKAADASLLKLKLGGGVAEDSARVAAVRAAVPAMPLIADANEGWTIDTLTALAPILASHGVAMIEQPLPRGADAALSRYRSPVPLCADESVTDCASLARLSDGYAMINIKLDKCGGLTEGLRLAEAALARGMGYIVGSNGGTSLAAAPAYVLAAAGACYADIDSPTMLVSDQDAAMMFAAGHVGAPCPALWG